MEAGKNWQVALVAFAGAGLANGGLYLLSHRFITSSWVATRPVAAYVLFWFFLMNLANLYSYVPMRVFAADGDVTHFRWATGVSPWVIYVVVGYLVLWAIIDFYRFVLPFSLDAIGVGRDGRAVVLFVATAVLLSYFAIPGLLEPDEMSKLIARTSLLAIPVILLLLWPRYVVAETLPRTAPDVR